VIVGVVQGDGREIESQTLFAIPWAALGLGLFGWPLSRALGHWYARSWLALAAPLIGALAGAIMAFPLLDMIGMCPVGRTCWRGSFLLLCRSALSSAPPPASGGGFSTAASLFAALHHKTDPATLLPIAATARIWPINPDIVTLCRAGAERGRRAKLLPCGAFKPSPAGATGASMADIARITEIIEPEVKALGFDLVRVRLFGKSEVGDEEHTLQIMAERPDTGQLIMDDCVTLSHRISDRIDALEEAGETLIMRPIAWKCPRRASTGR
jgi:hypothetical protein